MPLFGNAARFAVEYRLAEDCHGLWLFGGLCYWIAGERVGSLQQDVSLRDVFFALEVDRHNHSRRFNPELFSLPALELIAVLDGAAPGLFGRHNLNPGCGSFDDYRMYLVESELSARLVYRGPTDEARECSLTLHECDQVFGLVHRQLGWLYLDQLLRRQA